MIVIKETWTAVYDHELRVQQSYIVFSIHLTVHLITQLLCYLKQHGGICLLCG